MLYNNTRMTMQQRRSALFELRCWMVVVAVCFLSFSKVDARRRDPLSEAAFSSEGLITEESVKGTRSLFGSNVDVPVPQSPDDHLVTNLPLLNKKDFPTKHWAGLLPVNDKKDGYLFYWLFAPDPSSLAAAKMSGMVNSDESNLPVLVWLNGGPACSSMDGLWIENGPFRLNPPSNPGSGNWNDMNIDPFSWHNAPAYVLYIDQPVGTGLAFTTSGKYPKNDERVNEDFYYFMTEFFKLYSGMLGVIPKKHDGTKLMTLTRPLFFSGESHAGHYIPSMMNYIRKRNEDHKTLEKNGGIALPLTGAAIGNGWFDPFYQYSAHEAAYGNGLIGKAQERSLASKEKKCRDDLLRKKYTSNTCFQLLNDVVDNSLGQGNPSTVSQYDYTKWESRTRSRDFPPGHKDVEAFLGQTYKIPNADVQSVLTAIHATPSWDAGQRYRECTDPPYNALKHQDGLGVVNDIVELLEHASGGDNSRLLHGSTAHVDQKIKLLFFNGVHDLICNHAGNENALENLPWKHQTDYVRAERYGWKSHSTDQLGGYAKEYENLIFLKVLNSGHMVPMDVPEVALDMMITFLYSSGKSGAFDTYRQAINPVEETTSDGGGSKKCPITSCACPDSPNDAEECTKKQCQLAFDFAESGVEAERAEVTGIVWGASTFVLLAVFAIVCNCCLKCCGCRTPRTNKGRGYAKAGQIELNNARGGYSDTDDGGSGDGDENGFVEEDDVKII